MLIPTFTEVVEKAYKAPKFMFESPKMINQKWLLYRYILKNQRLKRHILDRVTHSGFITREFTTKENLNIQKNVLFYLTT